MKKSPFIYGNIVSKNTLINKDIIHKIYNGFEILDPAFEFGLIDSLIITPSINTK